MGRWVSSPGTRGSPASELIKLRSLALPLECLIQQLCREDGDLESE